MVAKATEGQDRKMALTFKSVVKRVGGLMSTPVAGDIVILNQDRDNYVALDEIGRRVWELIAEPRNVSDVCLKMAEEFDAPVATIRPDVIAFLDELAAEGLLHVAKT